MTPGRLGPDSHAQLSNLPGVSVSSRVPQGYGPVRRSPAEGMARAPPPRTPGTGGV